MELTGEVLMNAPRERVWSALNDPAMLQACIPGCEEVQDDSPTQRRVRLMVKVGPVRARFNGKVTLSDVVEPERCVMAFEGSGGAAGMASGRSQVELHPAEGGSRLTYTVKASVGGKLGQIGGRMMDASAKQLADQFFDNLRAKLAPVEAAPAVEPGEAPAEAVAAAAVAATAPPLPSRPAASPAVAPPAAHAEFSRVLWFVLGAASMGIGVWLGARLF
ncbi:MAG: carbon monoxide dehydrogenase [Comamonadaceae bacterium]|nr:MAG: carbon monoxide dehydrogenase [Comamonadaceae bacterium]